MHIANWQGNGHLQRDGGQRLGPVGYLVGAIDRELWCLQQSWDALCSCMIQFALV